MILVRTEKESSRNCSKIEDEINNEYVPVKIISAVPAGGVFQDKEGRLIAGSVFHVENNSDQEQSITFLLYQYNYKTKENQLFDIEHVYMYLHDHTKIEVENGVIKIPGGETMEIGIMGIPRDPSKVFTSRGSPKVEVVKLD